MRAVFEDDETKPLSKLFRMAYPEEISNTFEYSKGNRNIMNSIKKIFKDENFKESDEKVVVFMDVVPDNEEVIELYNDLLGKCHIFYPNRVIIIPILCAEYYFIKSIHDKNLIVDEESIHMCIEKFNYKNAPCIALATDEKDYQSFENFCKLVRDKCFKNCLSSKGRSAEQYLEKDCDNSCRSRCYDSNCNKISLLQKSMDLLVEYPLVPAGSYHIYKVNISYDEAEKARLQLLDELLEFEDMLIKQGYTTKKEIWRKIKC